MNLPEKGAHMVAKNANRFLLALGLALLLPGAAGAADFGRVERSFLEDWANPAELAARLWESWGELTGVWAGGGSIDPNGGEGTDGGGSIDPNGGGTNGAGVCAGGDCGATIDPNG
jgi:hypothetical protein